jgi:hypothetical protein
MWGEIPATLIRVSYLLDSGEGAESIWELGLADDFEIPHTKWIQNLTKRIPEVDLSTEGDK